MNQKRKPTTEHKSPTAAPASQIYYHRNEAVTIPDGYLAVGRITTAHSLKGEVRVELHTDFPERFVPGMVVYIGESLAEYRVDYARPHKLQLLVKLDGVDTRNEAEALGREWLFIPETDVVDLEDDTYWVHDIIGLQVQTEEGQELGVISEVLFTGANEVYVIKALDSERELLVPAIADVVQQVDLAAKRMTVRLLPGILDE